MKVKQLEWIGDIEEDEDISAEGLFGDYSVCRSNHGYGDLWSAIFNEEHKDSLDPYDGEIGIYAQAEKAKVCCQSHHEKRVKKAMKYMEGICSTQQ